MASNRRVPCGNPLCYHVRMHILIRRKWACTGLLVLLLLTVHSSQATPARADSVRLDTAGKPITPEPIRNYVNFRVGASGSTMEDRLNMCLEVAPAHIFSIEACGSGSGFLYEDPTPALTHFRTLWSLHAWHYEGSQIRPRLGLGFTELAVDEDKPGFFFTGTDPDGIETAGPEAMLALQVLHPLAAGWKLVADMNIGLAYLAHAPDLIRPMDPWQPFGAMTFGIGW